MNFLLIQQLQDPDFVASLFIFVAVVVTSLLFLYCYFGKNATESFQTMSDCLFEADWFDVRVDLQKYYIMIVQNAQHPIFYHGFHLAILDLSTFAKVSYYRSILKQSISYYLNIVSDDANGVYLLYGV